MDAIRRRNEEVDQRCTTMGDATIRLSDLDYAALRQYSAVVLAFVQEDGGALPLPNSMDAGVVRAVLDYTATGDARGMLLCNRHVVQEAIGWLGLEAAFRSTWAGYQPRTGPYWESIAAAGPQLWQDMVSEAKPREASMQSRCVLHPEVTKVPSSLTLLQDVEFGESGGYASLVKASNSLVLGEPCFKPDICAVEETVNGLPAFRYAAYDRREGHREGLVVAGGVFESCAAGMKPSDIDIFLVLDIPPTERVAQLAPLATQVGPRMMKMVWEGVDAIAQHHPDRLIMISGTPGVLNVDVMPQYAMACTGRCNPYESDNEESNNEEYDNEEYDNEESDNEEYDNEEEYETETQSTAASLQVWVDTKGGPDIRYQFVLTAFTSVEQVPALFDIDSCCVVKCLEGVMLSRRAVRAWSDGIVVFHPDSLSQRSCYRYLSKMRKGFAIAILGVPPMDVPRGEEKTVPPNDPHFICMPLVGNLLEKYKDNLFVAEPPQPPHIRARRFNHDDVRQAMVMLTGEQTTKFPDGYISRRLVGKASRGELVIGNIESFGYLMSRMVVPAVFCARARSCFLDIYAVARTVFVPPPGSINCLGNVKSSGVAGFEEDTVHDRWPQVTEPTVHANVTRYVLGAEMVGELE